MMAKLDNLGPFQFFFTLSCADKLWHENITAVLEANKIKVKYQFNTDGTENIHVGVEKDSEFKWIPLKEYMDYEMDITIHEIIR